MEHTMICAAGMIVRAAAGRDAGRFFVVTHTDGKDLFLADGQRRTLAHPKRKNPLHVRKTDQQIPLEGLTDKRLRTLLQPLNGSAENGSRFNDSSRKEVIDDVEAGRNRG